MSATGETGGKVDPMNEGKPTYTMADVPSDHRGIAIALVSEIRNALAPAAYLLERQDITEAETIAVFQRVLDYATLCASRLDQNESSGERVTGVRGMVADEFEAELKIRGYHGALGCNFAVVRDAIASRVAEKLAGRVVSAEQREADLREAYLAGGRDIGALDDANKRERLAAEYARSKPDGAR